MLVLLKRRRPSPENFWQRRSIITRDRNRILTALEFSRLEGYFSWYNPGDGVLMREWLYAGWSQDVLDLGCWWCKTQYIPPLGKLRIQCKHPYSNTAAKRFPEAVGFAPRGLTFGILRFLRAKGMDFPINSLVEHGHSQIKQGDSIASTLPSNGSFWTRAETARILLRISFIFPSRPWVLIVYFLFLSPNTRLNEIYSCSCLKRNRLILRKYWIERNKRKKLFFLQMFANNCKQANFILKHSCSHFEAHEIEKIPCSCLEARE